MASGEKDSKRIEIWIQFAAADRRTHGRDAAALVVGHLTQTAEVDQERAVAHAPSIPAVAAGAHGNCEVVFASKLHAGDHVVNGFPRRARPKGNAGACVLAATGAMRRILRKIAQAGTPAAAMQELPTFAEFVDFIGLPEVHQAEQRYAAKPAGPGPETGGIGGSNI